MSQNPNITVEFRDVNFQVGRRDLVSHLNLAIYQGEALVLLGRSGSGKTTTLKLINRLLLPTTGQILVGDRLTTKWKDRTAKKYWLCDSRDRAVPSLQC